MTDTLNPEAPEWREAVALLRELAALVRGECPSLLDEDSGGNARLSIAIDEALAKADQIAALAPSVSPPGGWRLVPEEPTREMFTAFAVAMSAPPPKGPNPTNTLDRMDLIARVVWQAVVAAAPEAPSASPPDLDAVKAALERCRELLINADADADDLAEYDAATEAVRLNLDEWNEVTAGRAALQSKDPRP